MALPTTDEDWVRYLTAVLEREKTALKVLNDEYELRAPRSYMHPEIFREVGDRLQQVVIAWPQLVVDSVEERLDPEGFGLPDDDGADDDLWRVWQANNLDEETQLGRVDALVMKRSYLCVGAGDDPDTPLVTVESPLEVFADIDPRTRLPRAALRLWTDGADSLVRVPERLATLYLPDRTVFYRLDGGWQETEGTRDEHQLGAVPIVPLVNRARLADRYGQSELSPILPLAHAANKIATDMMVAAEFVALPLRGIFGLGPGDLEDQDGNKLTALQAILGRLLTLPDDDGTARQFEFTSANLANFHDTIGQLARLVASIAGLPPDYLGLATDNPPSAESRRAGEIRLTKRAERKQVPFGGAYEHTMRLVKRIQEGAWDPRYRRLETKWRDPATPTIAQKADAAVKLYSTPGGPIVPRRQTREDLGYTDAQIRRMEAEDAAEAERDPLAAATRTLGQRLPVAAGPPAGEE
jgi:hypothetical protein